MNQEGEMHTLTFDDAFDELPDEASEDSSAALVLLQSLNPEFATIELTETKTVLGRQEKKCNPNALVNSAILSGEHCKFTTRSLTSKDAAIWITDLSRNGVWVNSTRAPFQEAKKIFDKDVITFVPPGKNAKDVNYPSYMLIDRRTCEDPKQPQASVAKRVIVEVAQEDDNQCGESLINDGDHITKKTKFTSSSEEQIESELECGICHAIMMRPLILQPCLHSFCKSCCKMWLLSHRDCPSCRKVVERTGHDFKLQNIITAFLKRHPELARDEDEDDGADSDGSNLIRRRPNRDNLFDHEDDEEQEDDDEEDFDNDDFDGIPHWVQIRPIVCPCCDPNNPLGYVCPDDVRLAPLPQPMTYAAYLRRRNMQPGHTLCNGCQDPLPRIIDPTRQAIANKFRCKMCHTPSCGCVTKSVEDYIRLEREASGFLNPAEDRILSEYLNAQGITHETFWRQIKTGMDNGSFYYLGPPGPVATSARSARSNDQIPAPAPAAITNAASDAIPGSSTHTTQNASSSVSLAPTTDTNPTTLAGLPRSTSTDDPTDDETAVKGSSSSAPAPHAAPDAQSRPQSAAGQNDRWVVASSDKLCVRCQVEYFRHGPIYQWRKSIDPALLPPRVASRADCWYGRGCRTQYNPLNPGHAERLNHICEPSK